MKLIIDRRIWLRGEGDADDNPADPACLLRESDGKRCCVGIYLRALGVPDSELKGVREAQGVRGLPADAHWLVDSHEHRMIQNSQAGLDLYDLNDAKRPGGVVREARIRKKFAEHGVEVRFVR